MKRIFLLLIACCFLSTISAQSTRKIRELEAKRKELHQQIAESETLLQSTKKDVKSQLDNLALLTGQIEERRKYINTIESDVHTLTSEIASLQKQLNKLQRDLKDKKRKYETSVQYMYRNKSVQEKLMFIFSAENLSQTYRRMRYVQEYANFQRLLIHPISLPGNKSPCTDNDQKHPYQYSANPFHTPLLLCMSCFSLSYHVTFSLKS